jgi:4-hydroxy-3-methylbut-2-en-1-yl diphosphate reductase
MNRSLRIRRIAVDAARHGHIIIANSFEDGDRGVIWTNAAPWLAATLRAELAQTGEGPRVVTGEAPAAVDGPAAKGAMLAVSYLDRDGTPGGFALVVHPADQQSLAIAERAAGRWLRLLRSRRLLVADVARLCAGGERALRMLESGVRDAEPLFILGTPVAAPDALRRLLRSGAVFTGNLDAVPDGARAAIPAHGAPLAVRAEAAARGMRLLDATCPLVAAAHQDAAGYSGRGDTVVVIGKAASAALPVLAAQAGDAAIIVGDAREAGQLRGVDQDRVSFVIDPAMRSGEALRAAAALRRRFPRLRGHHFGALCDAAADQASTVASVAAGSELMLVLTADPADAGTRALLAMCGGDVPAVTITSLADIEAGLLAGATAIGLAGALSAPAGLADQVIGVLSGLGPLSVAWRGTATRSAQAQSSFADAGSAG